MVIHNGVYHLVNQLKLCRMRALLDQEVDMEELFEYDENDEEDEEFSEKGK